MQSTDILLTTNGRHGDTLVTVEENENGDTSTTELLVPNNVVDQPDIPGDAEVSRLCYIQYYHQWLQ